LLDRTGSATCAALWACASSLLLVAAISSLTAVVQPLVMRRIQHEVADDIRATMLSMQALSPYM
jgi:hypothetical protein